MGQQAGGQTPVEIERLPVQWRALVPLVIVAIAAPAAIVASTWFPTPPTEAVQDVPVPTGEPKPIPAPKTPESTKTPTKTPTTKTPKTPKAPKTPTKTPTTKNPCDIAPDARLTGTLNRDHQRPGIAMNDPRADDTFQLLYAGFQRTTQGGDVDGGLAMMLAAVEDAEAHPWGLRAIGSAFAAKNCTAQAKHYLEAYVQRAPGAGDAKRVARLAARMDNLLQRGLPRRSDDARSRNEANALSLGHQVFSRCFIAWGSQAALDDNARCTDLSERMASQVDAFSDVELAAATNELETCRRTCAH